MSRHRREYLVLIAATLVWGSLHPTAKFALRELTPMQVALLRPVCACLVLTSLVVLSGRGRALERQLRATPRTLVALGFLGYASSGTLASLALQLLPAGITSLVSNASPLMVVLGGLLLFRQRVGLLALAGALVGFAGVALLGLGGAAPTGGLGPSLQGGALALAASASWATYTALARRLAGADPIVTTALTSGIGALLLGLVVIPTQDWAPLLHASWPARLAIFWAGGIATGCTYAGWSFALRRLPAVTVAPFAYVIPVSGLTIAHLWLGEPLTPAVLVGAALVLAGVALTQTANFRALLGAAAAPRSVDRRRASVSRPEPGAPARHTASPRPGAQHSGR